MPYIGGDVAGRGIDALDTVTNSTEPSSGRQLVMQYLMSKGLPQTGENMRRALEANARDPGTITNLVNNAPSTDAEDYAAGARGPASPGYGGPTGAGAVGRGGGSVARRVEGGGGGNERLPVPPIPPAGGAPTAANGIATTPGTAQPTPTDSSGWNWPLILGLTGGTGAGAGLTYAATRSRGGVGGSPTTSAPPTLSGATNLRGQPLATDANGWPTGTGAWAQGTSGPMPPSTPVAEGAPVELSPGMRAVNSAARPGGSIEVPPPIPGASLAQPGVAPIAAPSNAVNMDAVMGASNPASVAPPIPAEAPTATITPGRAGVQPPLQPTPEYLAEMAAGRTQRPVQPGPTESTPRTRAAQPASDPARLDQLRAQTGTDMSAQAADRVRQILAARAAGRTRIPLRLP